MLTRDNLHGYQNRAVDFFIEKKRVAFLIDMGLGKTVSSLTAITDLIDSMSVNKVLIIAPLRVAQTTWHTEALNWAHTKALKVNICTGNEKNRRAQLLKRADVYVINRENVEWLVNLYGKKWPFDCLIIDESSSFKSPSSRRFKALKKIITFTEYAAILTGTPASNGLLDLWSQYYLLDCGARLGRTMTSYKQRFFESDYMGFKFTPRKGAEEKIHDLLSDITLSMEAADYITLPPRIDSNVIVTMPPGVIKKYKDFEKDLILETEAEEDVVAESAAVLANKLLQFANGAIYTDDKGNWEEIHKSKIDALKDIVDDNAGENILVAYNYKTDLERLKKAFPQGVVMDKQGEAVDRWNNGEIKILFAHPASASMGINLQKGGSLLVWFGLTWSLEYYLQFNARLHRQGQKKPCRVIHIVSDGTIDERVLKVLGDKDAVQSSLLNALK